jgi:hypothetical protein
MTNFEPRPHGSGNLPPEAERDLKALRDATTRSLPGLEHSLSLARSRRPAAEPWKERWMSLTQPLKRNPWLATAAVGAAIVVALLVIPVSYEKTSGHEITLTLAGVTDMKQVSSIAQEFKTALGAGSVRVQASMENGQPTFKLEASTTGNAGEVRARAFGQTLLERGYTAEWAAMPTTERVWGSVYAYARDRVIQVSVDGKSAQQLQDEIRQRFAEAGITNAQVSVTDAGEGKHEVRIKAEREVEPGEPEPDHIQLQLTKDGRPVAEEGNSVEVRHLKDASGSMRMVVNLKAGGRSATAEVADFKSKSDAAVAAEINAQLVRVGINDLLVEVSGDEITLRNR